MTVENLNLAQAWSLLKDQASAQLIDVRTPQEWEATGTPDLGSIGKSLNKIEWTGPPPSNINPSFLDEVEKATEKADPVLLLCRSGGRSFAAATALAEAGYEKVYNVENGFEGGFGPDGVQVAGWRDELPASK